jgi:diguanylate cyclase (GGDEF)-like protein
MEDQAALRAEIDRLRDENQDLNHKAYFDDRTGLLNSRGFKEIAQERIAGFGALGRKAGSLRILLIDLNALKKINDDHGHKAGDIYLKTVAQFLSHNYPEKGLPLVRDDLKDLTMVSARYGGDEFCVLLSGDEDFVSGKTKEIRTALESFPLTLNHRAREQVSASVGESRWGPGRTYEDLMDSADRSMYRKKNGVR